MNEILSDAYSLFLYDIYSDDLYVLATGSKEEIQAHLKNKLSRVPYCRQWIDGDMQVIDYGSHLYYLKIYPIIKEE